eukprot:TRINITY_DN56922_c0_g1_i3.p1 TRINITY_DN56922_c0_g1~~TRINITY_DN56922_c0_g1_i3.p1  ORF type:complete len:471 (-),score=75.96 TRINITY_DN56922_c0_g1_i3:167-1579(-)
MITDEQRPVTLHAEADAGLAGVVAASVAADSATSDFNASDDGTPLNFQRTPRCCRTHALEHHSVKAAVAAAGLAHEDSCTQTFAAPVGPDAEELQALHDASQGDAWLVLIGGEHGGIMRKDAKKTRPGPYLAGHCSLQWIGITYSRLVDFFGRDRTIVITQLQETLEWLREASKDEEHAQRLAGRATHMPMLKRRLSETERDCARLIEEGGADYDGASVNPSTVLDVLRGHARANADGSTCKVVPQKDVGSVVVVFISHGHAHPAGGGTRNHEWYMHFPHPVPDAAVGDYDVVSYEGFSEVDPYPDWDWGLPKWRWRLYSQMLFKAHHEVLERTPRRRLVLLHQFCLSGGAADFMRRNAYQAYCGTRTWPVFAMVTAGRFEPALGSFVDYWTQQFASALKDGGHRTVGDVYREAERIYWEANSELYRFNASIPVAQDQSPEDDANATSRVGTIGCEFGFDAWSLRPSSDV